MMDPEFHEIDQGAAYIGYREALESVYSNVRPLGAEEIALESGLHRISDQDVMAQVRHPSTDISLKDGFALRSADAAGASRKHSLFLKIIGSAFAGSDFEGELKSGCAVKVCSGATIPAGANAVIASEFCEETSANGLRIYSDADEGRNILHSGEEIEKDAIILRKGDLISPGAMGLAAAAGITHVRVCRRPKAAIVAIGDELKLPGTPLRPGQVYASNLIALKAWLNSFGIECLSSVVRDNPESIKSDLEKIKDAADIILTSGGAWGSERDLVVGILSALEWNNIFHHVRMGPGKGISFGLWDSAPVFCLPGGPASNEMAFLQLALPGILKMAGDRRPPLPSISATLIETVNGRHEAWTEFKNAVLSKTPDGSYAVGPYSTGSRLQAIARSNALICIPEGRKSLNGGERINVQILTQMR